MYIAHCTLLWLSGQQESNYGIGNEKSLRSKGNTVRGKSEIACREKLTAFVQNRRGNIRTEALNEIIERRGSKGNTYIVPEIMAVTARTPTGTVADIDSQRHLVGYLLKNNSCINVLQHSLFCVCIETT